MKHILSLVFCAFLLSGCSSIGTKVLYYAPESNIVIKKIGVINLVADSINIKVCPTIHAVTDSVIHASSLENTDFRFTLLEESKDFERVNLHKDSFSEISMKMQLDALLIVDSRFINVNYSIAYIPVSSEYHSESLVTLFSNQGVKLISISHNTSRGDNFIERPSPEVTVIDAVQIAIKRLLLQTRSLNKRVSG